MRGRSIGICLLLILLLLGWAKNSQAAAFTADLVLTQNGREFSGRLYVRDNMIRQELNVKSETRITIIRADRKTVWTLMPNSHTYLEAAFLGTRTDVKPYGVKTEDIRETRMVGTEVLNGYTCNIIQYVFYDNKINMTQWVAQPLNFPIKTEVQGLNGLKLSEEVKNITETIPPESLFDIPTGYQRLSFQ